MEELEKALGKLKLFLEKAGYEEANDLVIMSQEELSELFRKIKRDVRKRERIYSPNSEEYKSLNEQRTLVESIEKMIREKEKEKSGLMLSTDIVEEASKKDEVVTETKNTGFIYKAYEWSRLEMYKMYMEAGRVDMKQKVYREVAKKAETEPECLCLLARFEEMEQINKDRIVRLYDKVARNGNAEIAFELANKSKEGVLLSSDMVKTYSDMAVEFGQVNAILDKAYALAGIKEDGCYKKDTKEAFSILKEYLMSCTSISMANDSDREVVYYYYKLGIEHGYNMLKETVTVPLKDLIENKGTYTQEANYLEGHMYVNANLYYEAIMLFLGIGTIAATEEVEKLFFSDYYNQREEEQHKLDKYLEGLLYSEDTVSEVREELFKWYGWRYEVGKKMICNKVAAYAHYGKASLLGGLKKYEKYKNRILEKLSINERLVLFEDVVEYQFLDLSCYTQVYLPWGQTYEAKYMYEQACKIYMEGSRYSTNSIVREKCMAAYKRCDEKIVKRKVWMKEAEDSYNQCDTTLVGQKRGGFERLRDMAKRGNTYAALRFAQVAENDIYLKNVMKGEFPSEEEIFTCYKKAAESGEREAISRMVDILMHGQLGQSRNTVTAERWREKI